MLYHYMLTHDCWLMLLPCGRCKTTYGFEVGVNLFCLLWLMADVIAMCMVLDNLYEEKLNLHDVKQNEKPSYA